MKKFLYVANIRLPTEKAHGVQIMKMCEAFAKKGIEVELVIPTRRNLFFKNSDPFNYFGIEKKFPITRLRTFDPYWLIYLPQGIYIKFQSLFFQLSLYFYLSRQKYRENCLIYARDEYLLRFLQRLFPKVIWEAHNLPRNKVRYQKVWKNCFKIVAISGGLKRELVDFGIDEQKIFVAPDGVDLQNFSAQGGSAPGGQFRKALGLPEDKKIIMYTGHLYGWKGAYILLEAARNSKFQIPNSKFIFVGGTPNDVERFKTKARGMGNIMVLGHRPPSEIPQYLSTADILVLPNSATSEISRIYTSPLKLFEYLASGKPIVASDLPSIREIVSPEQVEFAKPDDPSSLAAAISRAFGRDSSRNQKFVEKYSWINRAQKIIDLAGEKP